MKGGNHHSEIPEVEPEINTRAVSLYGQNDALEDFPVLKAFQQYVDAEQSKARKRMLTLSIFFAVIMAAVVSVFVFLLIRVGAQNQNLNDRLVEYAMQERERRGNETTPQPVVVQPQQDSAAILALTSKIDDLQKKLAADQAKAEQAAKDARDRAEKAIAEAQARADKAAAEAAASEKARLEAVKAAEEASKGPSAEELEIERLKALLALEKKKVATRSAAEKERKREEELEAYRRKHYPDYYERKGERNVGQKETADQSPSSDRDDRDILDEVDDILKDIKSRQAVPDDETVESEKSSAKAAPSAKAKQIVKPKQPVKAKSVQQKKELPAAVETAPAEAPVEKKKIKFDLKGGNQLTLDIPE